jgi:hypothetical protein
VGAVERVERVEELFLRALLPGEELDVVDQEHVGGAVAALELERGGVLDRVDHLVHELLGGHEEDPGPAPLLADVVPDRVHQVGLPESHTSVNEERVVPLARALGHRLANRVGELIAAPHDEGLERVVLAEIALIPGRNRPTRAILLHHRPAGTHVEGDPHRALRRCRDRRLDQRAVVLIEPVDVELAGSLQHQRRPVELERA